MTDIAERLRQSLQINQPHLLRNADIAEAANEIMWLRAALEDIALLDEADGHELRSWHAAEAVAIATKALGKHPSEILATRAAHTSAERVSGKD